MKKFLLFLILAGFTIPSFSQPKKMLLGYWYKPKTQVNVRFYRNKTFVYNDYNPAANSSQKLTGKYSLKDTVLTLNFEDKSKQVLSFYKFKSGNKNYYLKKGNDFFIKGERVNNAVPEDPLQKENR